MEVEVPRLREGQPPDLPAFRRLLKELYEAYSQAPGANHSRLSKAKVSIACGMQDPGWLNKVISGAPGCANFRTETLVRFANVLSVSVKDRKRLARAAGRDFASFAPLSVSSSLETISMRRAVLLMTSHQPSDAAYAIKNLGSDLPKVSLRLSRVFGAHDMILRVTTPIGRLVLPDIVDKVRYSGGATRTDTLLVRDDLQFVARGYGGGASRNERSRIAYIFLNNTGSFGHDQIITAMIDAAAPLAIDLLTAAILVGRFDAVAEISLDRLNHLDMFIQSLRRSLAGEPTTTTYPSVQILYEADKTAW
jgi:hypothetical protein